MVNETEATVVDQGVGIATEAQERIFNVFEQADSSTSKHYGGTGLGLAISRRLVELMGGTIWVKSTPGVGSEFHFTAFFGQEHHCLPEGSFSGMRFLVLDEHEVNRRTLSGYLAGWGAHPYTAASPLDALAMLRQGVQDGTPFALALVDLQLQGGRVWSTIEEMRALSREVLKIVVMSRTSNRGDSEICRRLGVNGYLVKPVIYDELQETVAAALNGTDSPLAVQPPGEASDSELPQLNILLADDVEANRELALAMLARQGHRVTLVSNGLEAVEAYGAGKYDVVLMDVQMPDMDGLMATRAIREQESRSGRRTPILALTAYAGEKDREKCLLAGMDGHISKPFRSRELFAVLREYCCSGEAVQNAADFSVDAGSAIDGMVFDRQGLLDRLDGRGELIAKFIDMFRTTADTRWADLNQAAVQGDTAAMRIHAHSIKGAAANIGAERVRAVSLFIETAAGDGKLDEALASMAQLKEEIELFFSETRAARGGSR